tara:strand:- start:54 stop:179 length:126 start_codon:yes stop_codon:yes gene_type:complete
MRKESKTPELPEICDFEGGFQGGKFALVSLLIMIGGSCSEA